MKIIKSYINFTNKLNDKTGAIASWLTLALVLLVSYDVMMRYLFNISNVAIQELEWHLFAVIFLFGAAYTFKTDNHVRVDLIYSKFSMRTKAWINILGTVLFLIPFCLVVIYTSRDFVINSFLVSEGSPDPGGLPARYILKAILPLSFFFVLLQGTVILLESILILLNKEETE